MTEERNDRELSVAPDELAAIGTRLTADASRLGDSAARVLAGFDADPDVPHRAYAADPRNEPAQPIVERHEAAVEAARELLGALESGLDALGRAATAAGREFSVHDAELATETGRAGDHPGGSHGTV